MLLYVTCLFTQKLYRTEKKIIIIIKGSLKLNLVEIMRGKILWNIYANDTGYIKELFSEYRLVLFRNSTFEQPGEYFVMFLIFIISYTCM